jgi:superfamily II DNA or RNA helicase
MSSTSLTYRGYGLLKSAFDEVTIDRLRKEFTVAPKTIPGYSLDSPVQFTVYLESPLKLYIPKSYGLQHYDIPEDDRLSEGDPIRVPFAGQLRPEQHVPVDAFLEAAHDPRRRGGMINVPCGGGKTVMSIYLITHLARKTIVIVHKDFLLKQWKERIEQYAPTARLGLIKGKILDTDDCDIVLASLQSLCMKDYPPSVFASFGFVIIDEVHHMGAEVFSQAFHKVNVRYALGLSATPQRKDGLTKVLHWFLGDFVYTGERRRDTVHVHIHEYAAPDDPSYGVVHQMFNGKPNIARMVNELCDYMPRTEYIVRCIQTVLVSEPHRRVLILSERRSHLDTMSQLLNVIYPNEVGFYMGGMKEEELKESESKRFVLGTYAMASEAMDVPGLDTLVFASPKSDIEQSVGRILRLKEKDRRYTPLIIDLMDPHFPNPSRKRRQYYRRYEYVIETTKQKEEAVIEFRSMRRK